MDTSLQIEFGGVVCSPFIDVFPLDGYPSDGFPISCTPIKLSITVPFPKYLSSIDCTIATEVSLKIQL